MYEFRRHKVCIVRIPTFHECNFPLFPHTGRLTVGSQTSRHENHPSLKNQIFIATKAKSRKEQKNIMTVRVWSQAAAPPASLCPDKKGAPRRPVAGGSGAGDQHPHAAGPPQHRPPLRDNADQHGGPHGAPPLPWGGGG